MQPQPYLLTLITLFAVLTPQHGVSATLTVPQRPIRGETKIVPAPFLLQASSRQNEQVAQARGDDSGKAEAREHVLLRYRQFLFIRKDEKFNSS